jgi:hypothetical protein
MHKGKTEASTMSVLGSCLGIRAGKSLVITIHPILPHDNILSDTMGLRCCFCPPFRTDFATTFSVAVLSFCYSTLKLSLTAIWRNICYIQLQQLSSRCNADYYESDTTKTSAITQALFLKTKPTPSRVVPTLLEINLKLSNVTRGERLRKELLHTLDQKHSLAKFLSL